MNRLEQVGNSVLFLCVSMYLGTGWSLVLFSFPVAGQLTVDNYYLVFVPQVTAATQFFTWMTVVMLVLAAIMTINEWKTGWAWVPVTVIVMTIAATLLTIFAIIPLNREMAEHISDPQRLRFVLQKWIDLNWIRVILWSIQWLALMYYFAAAAARMRERATS